jgi:class 3 adenylate cyclase
MSDNLPSGTVTFLFTDIEGSTQLLQRLGDEYAAALADQRQILRAVFEKYEGLRSIRKAIVSSSALSKLCRL